MVRKGLRLGIMTVFFLGMVAATQAQALYQLSPENRGTVLRLMHTLMPKEMYEGMMKQVREEMYAQVNDYARRQNKSLPADASERMQRAIRNSVSYDEIVVLTAEAYTKRFSPDEIRQIAEFYDTQVGRKLAQIQPEIMADIMPKITNNINARVLEAMRKEGLVTQASSSQ